MFSSNRAGTSGIYCQPSDGSGVAAPLRCTEIDQVPGSWSPDGQVLLLTEYHPDSGADLWCYATETGRTDPFLRTRFNEYGPAFSPDGRWVAYTSDESGRPEVYVVAYPGADRKCQLSTDGGAEPIWAKDGRQLFYRSGGSMMAVSVAPAAEGERFGVPRPLFEGSFVEGMVTGLPNYDVFPDGGFVMVAKSPPPPPPRELCVVLRWFLELSAGSGPTSHRRGNA